MITASCIFFEGVRKEASGQETWVGVCGTTQVVFQAGEPASLFARITVHIPATEQDLEFGVRVVDDLGNDEFITPSPEMVAAGVRAGRENGFAIVPLAATIDLGNATGSLKLFLVTEGCQTLIGTVSRSAAED